MKISIIRPVLIGRADELATTAKLEQARPEGRVGVSYPGPRDQNAPF